MVRLADSRGPLALALVTGLSLSRITLLVFLTFQAADGLMTYGAASLFGAGVEGNPLIATWMHVIGVGPALFLLGRHEVEEQRGEATPRSSRRQQPCHLVALGPRQQPALGVPDTRPLLRAADLRHHVAVESERLHRSLGSVGRERRQQGTRGQGRERVGGYSTADREPGLEPPHGVDFHAETDP